MLPNKKYHKKITTIDTSIQLVMPLDCEILVPEDDSVRLLSQIVEELDLTSLYQAYSLSGRNPAVPPRVMLKIMLYAYMEGIYSSRKIEKACHRDINFKWLLEGYPVPDHNTICRFRTERLTVCLQDIFIKFVELLHAEGEIAFENVFIDGTKIEASANKYSFVWKKTADKNHTKLMGKIHGFINAVIESYEIKLDEIDELTALYKIKMNLSEKVDSDKIELVHGRGKRKTQIQKDYESVCDLIEKKQMYDEYFRLFNGRSNFCKTDTDATFLHMKDDHMRNAQLKPGYNMQIAVEGGYVIACQAFPDANDLRTLIPFLDSIYEIYGKRIANVVCDAGYESEENYSYLKEHEQIAHIKPAMYDKWTKRSFKKDISKIENMEYDKEGNFYICSQGNKLEFKGMTTVKRRKSNYESEVSTYECAGCMDCPVKSKCTKAKGNRKIQVSHKFLELRAESHKNITSEKGIELRVNRSIQAEGAFGAMKEDMDFRRFLTRGKENITVEYQLLCLGFNINKLHNKILSNKCGQLLYKVPQAA